MEKIKSIACISDIFVNMLLLAGVSLGCWLVNKNSKVKLLKGLITDEEKDNLATEKWHKKYDRCYSKDRQDPENKLQGQN